MVLRQITGIYLPVIIYGTVKYFDNEHTHHN